MSQRGISRQYWWPKEGKLRVRWSAEAGLTLDGRDLDTEIIGTEMTGRYSQAIDWCRWLREVTLRLPPEQARSKVLQAFQIHEQEPGLDECWEQSLVGELIIYCHDEEDATSALGHPLIPRWLLDRALRSSNFEYVAAAAANPQMKPRELERLSRHHSVQVRKSVACNESTPFRVLRRLAKDDPNEVVGHLAARRLITAKVKQDWGELERVAQIRQRQYAERIQRELDEWAR